MSDEHIPAASMESSDWQNNAFVDESPTGRIFSICIRDKRSPAEIKSMLERDIMVLFSVALENEKLCMRANATVVGAKYNFFLSFDAALPRLNYYSLNVSVSWAEQSVDNFEYYRKTSSSWFQLWTRDFETSSPSSSIEGSKELYRKLSDQVLNDLSQLDSVQAIQQKIMAAMKNGATYRNSHKEGGTNIYWKNGLYVRSDYGDSSSETHFSNDQDFLSMLRQFCHWEITRNSGSATMSNVDTWRLIMHCMQRN